MEYAIRPTESRSLAVAGQVANGYAHKNGWSKYLRTMSANTIRNQRSDLATFVDFLASTGVQPLPAPDDLQNGPDAWRGVTHGLVEAFVEWMVQRGYSIASVNRKLATVKRYARLAQADSEIDGVRGIGHKAGRNLDKGRHEAGIPTRIGAKKEYKAVSLTFDQAKALKAQPDTPQGRRDALLMCLLLDHGLRCGEVAGLQVADFNLAEGKMTFYRPKVDKVQTHNLTADTLRALLAYVNAGDAPAIGPLLRGSRKGGELTDDAMSERAITARVRYLGRERLEIPNVSAHDCRHYWATRATQQGTHPKALQQAGGWNSGQMVMRYIDETTVANEGVIL